jgi:hypothetical protein
VNVIGGQSSLKAVTRFPALLGNLLTTVALLTVVVIAAASASASLQSYRMADAPPSVGRKVLQEFAWCTVRREPVLAQAFVQLVDPGHMPGAEFQRLFDASCLFPLAGQLQMRSWQSRAALAEALLLRDGTLRRTMSFAGVRALDWPVETWPVSAGKPSDPGAVSRFADAAARDQSVSRLGECVVRADPVGSMTVLRTEIDTGAERKRFAALSPRIASCVQEGQTLAFNRTNLRAAMALAYYRLATAKTAQGKI